MRITQQMLTEGALRRLGLNVQSLQHLQEQISTGRRLNRPSDDPSQVRSAVNLRDSLAELDQFLRNGEVAEREMNAADSALREANTALQRIRELAVQGANGTLSPTDRQNMALEVAELGNAIVQNAATKVGDRYIFSGFRVDQPPYASLTGRYQGDSGAIVARIAPSVTLQTNVTADVAFAPTLAAISQLQAELASGSPVGGATLTAIDTGQNALLAAQATLGARTNRLDTTRTSLEDGKLAATQLLSNIEDVDLASALAHLSERQATYEASLKMTSRILQQSLFDVL